MKIYHQLETPKLYAVVKLEVLDDDGNLSDGALVNPASSIQIIIADPTGLIVQALADMDSIAAGKFCYSGYTIPTNAVTGKYAYEVRAKDGTKTAIAKGYFEVVEEIV